MSEEILIRQGAPTLAGIKTGSLFPCPCDDREALLTDVRRLNRQLVPKGLCLLPIRFKDGQALLYLYRPAVLHRDLQDGLAQRILTQAGYACGGCGRCGWALTLWRPSSGGRLCGWSSFRFIRPPSNRGSGKAFDGDHSVSQSKQQ